MRYRKKPVEVEVIQWTGNNYTEICLFVGKDLLMSVPPRQMTYERDDIPNSAYTIIIPTLEGDMEAMKGDYIIRGVQGEFYPCKPDIFTMTYDLILEPTEEEGKQ